jgi:hypothetical protein
MTCSSVMLQQLLASSKGQADSGGSAQPSCLLVIGQERTTAGAPHLQPWEMLWCSVAQRLVMVPSAAGTLLPNLHLSSCYDNILLLLNINRWSLHWALPARILPSTQSLPQIAGRPLPLPFCLAYTPGGKGLAYSNSKFLRCRWRAGWQPPYWRRRPTPPAARTPFQSNSR